MNDFILREFYMKTNFCLHVFHSSAASNTNSHSFPKTADFCCPFECENHVSNLLCLSPSFLYLQSTKLW